MNKRLSKAIAVLAIGIALLLEPVRCALALSIIYPLKSVAFSHDGTRVYAAGTVGLHLWELSKVEPNKYEGRQSLVISRKDLEDVTLSPDGKTIAALERVWRDGKHRGIVHLWDAESNALKQSLPEQEFYPMELSYSPSGDLLLAVGSERVFVWDMTTSKLKFSVQEPKRQINSASFSPDSKCILIASVLSTYERGRHDGILRLWDVATGQPQRVVVKVPRDVSQAKFSPDGKFIVGAQYFGGGGSVIRFWDTQYGLSQRTLPADWRTQRILDLNWMPNSQILASASSRKITIWNNKLSGAEQLQVIDRSMSYSRDIAFSPDGQWLAETAWNVNLYRKKTDGAGEYELFAQLEPADYRQDKIVN